MRKFFIDKQTRMRKSLSTIMAFLLLLCATTAYSQTGTVTGTVRDTNNEPLIGVNVSVRGTTNGTITNVDGQFTLQGVSAQSVLVFSYIGFVSQEITVGSQRTINAQLREDTQNLEEVIVVGYGTRKAGELTGSVSTVKSEEIHRLAAVSTEEVLRNVPGVTVMQANIPGSTPNVIVRGVGTINNAGPLWVVDGIPGGTVTPEDIETVTVLKDAAAQAIYGTRAANGVILVTTKAGKKNQRTNITFSARAGNTRNTNYYRMLNTQEYGELLWLEAKNDGISDKYSHPLYGSGSSPVIPDYIFPNGAKLGTVDESRYSWVTAEEGGTDTYLITRSNPIGTDWLREISQVAVFQDYSINLTGGGDKTTYAFTVGYMQEEGIMKYTSFDRWNFRSSITSDVNKWLKVGQIISGTYSNQNGFNENNNSESSAVSWAYRMQPIIPMYDIGGHYAGTRVGGQTGNAQNPLQLLDQNQYDNRERMNITANAFMEIKPFEGLTVRSLFGMNYSTYFYKNIDYVDKSHSERGRYDYLYHTANKTRQWTWQNTAEYKKTIGLNAFTLMLATEAIENTYYQATAQRYNYAIKDPKYIELSSGIDGQQNNSSKRAWSLFSVFGRLNYVFDNKYLFEGVVRRDGSSRFSAGHRYGTFPAVSVGWVISRESFMASTRSWLDNLKLRGGYGTTGNDQMDNYNSYSTYDFTNDSSQGSMYSLTGANATQGTLGFRQNRIGNENVKWEVVRTTNVAFDAALFGKMTLTFDYWQRRTTDMLYPRAIPQVYGRATAPSVNVGEMLNKGFDLDLGYNGTALNRDLRYQLNLNVSRYKNEIVNLTGNDSEFLDGGAFREHVYTRSMKGHSYPEFYGYVVEGIFQTEAEAKAWPEAFGDKDYNAPGRFKYKDVNGDGKINADDRDWIGSPHPTFTAGLNFNVEYKGFDLNGQFYSSYGNKLVNYVRRFIDYYQFEGGRSYDRLYKSWGSPHLSDNSKAKLPIAERSSTRTQLPSTAFVEDASYLRLRNLQIGYNLGKLINVPDISTLRVYIQVTNLLTFSKYSGLDPETSRGAERDDSRNFGIDSGSVPTPRRILFGLTLGL